MDRLTDTEALLGRLIAHQTVSRHSNLALIGEVADRLSALGARIRLSHDPSGRLANLFASFGPEGDGGIVLSGHSDVVPVEGQEWQSDPFRLTERDGRLYGRGSCDMKGFVAACLAMAPDFAAARLAQPLHIALTYDEEIGCFGATRLAEDLTEAGLRPRLAIIGEPTGMRMVEGHKGCFEYTTEFTGLEGHGSMPARGVNAVSFAVRYAARLMALGAALEARAPAGTRFDPPWTTLQIGRIAGGIARNVIPGHAEIDWELRPVCRADADFVLTAIDAEAERLVAEMRMVSPGAAIERLTIAEVAGLEPVPENDARALVAALTGETEAELVAFGTEAGIFQALGMDCVICGPGSIEQAHKPDEFVSRDQLAACLRMLQGLCARLAA